MGDKLLHLISINTQGLRDKFKRLRLNEWLKNQEPDIVLLQETHFSQDLIPCLIDEYGEWKLYHSFGESNCRGVSIFINKSLEINIIDSISDEDGRYYFMNFETCNNTFSVLNVYAPNDKKVRNTFL